MSRLSLLLALLFAVPAASAQSVLSDSTSTYFIPQAGYAYSSEVGQAGYVGGILGRRVSERVDLGVRLDVGDRSLAGTALFAIVGPQMGVTGTVFGLDASARLGAVAQVGQRARPADAAGLQAGVLQGEFTVSESFRSLRGLRIAPTGGLYGAACATRTAATAAGDRCAELGLVTGFELGFRAFGADVSVPLTVHRRLLGNQRRLADADLGVLDAPVSGGARIRF